MDHYRCATAPVFADQDRTTILMHNAERVRRRANWINDASVTLAPVVIVRCEISAGFNLLHWEDKYENT